MARKKVGKISTGGWIAIGLGAAAVAYIATRPKPVTTTLPPGYYPPGYYPPSGNNTTTTIANDATSVLNNLLGLFY